MEKKMSDKLILPLCGHIDSNNSAQVESELNEKIAGAGQASLVLDASKLEYISSAGLRVILRLKKNNPDLCIINVSSDCM